MSTVFIFGDFLNSKKKYLSSAFLLLVSSVIVKVIGAVYKIPLTAFIGAVGRGYFAAAYNLYLPLHAVIMGAVPIALSRLVSKYAAKDNKTMLSSLKRGAGSLFFTVGLVGTAVLVIAAKPYSEFIASSPKSIYTILVLAPSLFFSCLAACYRGYYEGFMDMKPTAVSQTLEALVKMVFGLLFAKYSMAYLYNQYINSGEIFGVRLNGEKEALGFIYPYTSAMAMLGVTFGTFLSFVYVFIYDKISKTKTEKVSKREGRRELFYFSLPIMISCSVQSVFQFLDTSSVQLAIKGYSNEFLKSAFSSSLKLTKVADGDLSTYVWGLFCTALDFKNLIPGITMALGVCAVPAICREYEKRNTEKTDVLINSIYKYTSVVSVFMGAFIFLCSKDILGVFFIKSSPDIVQGCNETVKYFALTAPIYSLASISVYCVQAVGKPEKSILSYVISGGARCVLNYVFVSDKRLLLTGAVLSGAIGYFILFIMNMNIERRVSKTKFRLFDNVLRPVLIGVITCFLCKITYTHINFSKNLTFNLLIEFTIFGLIYCILCFFFKVLNFKEIFSILNLKKLA